MDSPQPTPPTASDGSNDAQTAADLIRDKLDRLYGEEPSVIDEVAEARTKPNRSKHQQFMYELSTSGKDLAAIQVAWHEYYQNLPAADKHQVWQEFYDSQALAIHPQPVLGAAVDPRREAQLLAEHKHQVVRSAQAKPATAPKSARLRDARTTVEIQTALRDKVTGGGKLQTKHHIQSLLFGLGLGLVVVLIFLFGFFNEVFIAPFIQPSRVIQATPLIVTSNSVAPTTTPEVIIPKINVEIPVDYTETSTDENTIENDLQNGVVHYPTTGMPGQQGNTAFFGHSSNNIFNKGKYKFAFVLLHTLVVGDTFYLTYNSKVYIYRVISRSIVDPSDVSVLGPVAGQTATATLITCDPPGTSLHRLIVVGQQISPDPAANSQPTITASASPQTPAELPGNGPTLWTRFSASSYGKVLIAVVLIGGLAWIARRINAPLRQLRH